MFENLGNSEANIDPEMLKRMLDRFNKDGSLQKVMEDQASIMLGVGKDYYQRYHKNLCDTNLRDISSDFEIGNVVGGWSKIILHTLDRLGVMNKLTDPGEVLAKMAIEYIEYLDQQQHSLIYKAPLSSNMPVFFPVLMFLTGLHIRKHLGQPDWNGELGCIYDQINAGVSPGFDVSEYAETVTQLLTKMFEITRIVNHKVFPEKAQRFTELVDNAIAMAVSEVKQTVLAREDKKELDELVTTGLDSIKDRVGAVDPEMFSVFSSAHKFGLLLLLMNTKEISSEIVERVVIEYEDFSYAPKKE
jgi:hypothetical protein